MQLCPYNALRLKPILLSLRHICATQCLRIASKIFTEQTSWWATMLVKLLLLFCLQGLRLGCSQYQHLPTGSLDVNCGSYLCYFGNYWILYFCYSGNCWPPLDIIGLNWVFIISAGTGVSEVGMMFLRCWLATMGDAASQQVIRCVMCKVCWEVVYVGGMTFR